MDYTKLICHRMPERSFFSEDINFQFVLDVLDFILLCLCILFMHISFILIIISI